MGKIIRNGIVYAGSPNVEVIDAYTKTESNSRFASKSIYGDRAIQLNSYSYSVSIGGNNREDYPFIGNVMIGVDNRIFGATYNNCIIGHNNEISKSVTSGDKNIVIGNYIDYQGEYGVAIGYDENYMEVCPNGDVISRGNVICDNGSGTQLNMKNMLEVVTGKVIFTSTSTLGIQQVQATFPRTLPRKPKVVMINWCDSVNTPTHMDYVYVQDGSITVSGFTALAKRLTAGYNWYADYAAFY